MATARCYTKSGSVEKYESNLWSSPSTGNWSSLGVLGTITTPDSRGNYTVTPANEYEDSNTQTEFYCYTMYGGVRKTFYFKTKNYQNYQITFYGYMKMEENGTIGFYCNVTTFPINTVANFNATVRFIYNEILTNGVITPAYTKIINRTITNFPSMIHETANLHNPDSRLHNFKFDVVSPKPPLNINGHNYEIFITSPSYPS